MRTYKILTPSKQISVIEGSAITISVSKISKPIFIKQKTATRCASVGFRRNAWHQDTEISLKKFLKELLCSSKRH